MPKKKYLLSEEGLKASWDAGSKHYNKITPFGLQTDGDRFETIVLHVAAAEHQAHIDAGYQSPDGIKLMSQEAMRAEIEQAKTEVAREIFEAVEKASTRMNTNMSGISLSCEWWQAYKTKYIVPPKVQMYICPKAEKCKLWCPTHKKEHEHRSSCDLDCEGPFPCVPVPAKPGRNAKQFGIPSGIVEGERKYPPDKVSSV